MRFIYLYFYEKVWYKQMQIVYQPVADPDGGATGEHPV